MFRGVAYISLDSKGRLAVPAKYRDVLVERCAGRLIVTVDPSRCAILYPYPDWEPVYARLMELPSFEPRSRWLQRLIGGHAEELTIDAQGRIVVPPAVRDYARLEARAALVGQGNRIELWDEGRWKEEIGAEHGSGSDDLPSSVRSFSL